MSTIKEFYDNCSHRYEEFEAVALVERDKYPLLYAIRNRERELLSKAKGKKVFYFATGSGADVVHLVTLGAKVVTLDFSIEMINRTVERLKREGIGYRLLRDTEELTAEFADDFFDDNEDSVLILLADVHKARFPQDYFDYTFCYCTLPLLGDKAIEVLRDLLRISKNGAVSVYLKEKLSDLHNYYVDFGFNSEVKDDVISLAGGFAYTAISPSEMTETIKVHKELEVLEVGLGNIYVWK